MQRPLFQFLYNENLSKEQQTRIGENITTKSLHSFSKQVLNIEK